jgi:N6-L-threonylcarbamoyladenine synthase
MRSSGARLTLAFESSCDETAVAVVDEGLRVLSNVISSQIDIHRLYGGVVPEVASRNHLMRIEGVMQEALRVAGVTLEQIHQIAATTHPGLVGAVMVGAVFARSLATARNLPFVEVNHIAGHIASVVLTNPQIRPPFVSLVVSGGHTSLYCVESEERKAKSEKCALKIKLIEQTMDDAAGEAFDKVAKILGLPYPGGPEISRAAEGCADDIRFVANPNYCKDGFSYSGLKTAVLNYVNRKKQRGEAIDVGSVAASFQREAVEQLVAKCIAVLKKTGIKTLSICGGVSANRLLRNEIERAAAEIGAVVLMPELSLCVDNAAMVAAAAILDIRFE